MVASKEITTSLNVGIQIRLGEALIADLVRSQAFEILQRRKCPFARQAIECPKQQHIKFSLRSMEEHLLKRGARRDRTSLVVNVFRSNRITSTMAWISGRGVKYCPAPFFTSAVCRSSAIAAAQPQKKAVNVEAGTRNRAGYARLTLAAILTDDYACSFLDTDQFVARNRCMALLVSIRP